MKYNTKISIQPGLQDTFGVFNLDAEFAFNNIRVDVIIDGDQYVESDVSQTLHAGTSSFKEFDGIKPEDSNTWDLSNYGEKFRAKLIKYFSDYAQDINNSRGFDIYEDALAYKNYQNQFTIKFKDEADPSVVLTGQYINYKNQPALADGKTCISRTLNEVNGSDSSRYIFLNANVIHFSKYYHVYKSSDISVPVLQPVLYTQEDLAKLNLTIANNNVYVNSLSMFTAWNDDNGSNRDFRREYRYDCNPNNGNFKIEEESISNFNHTADVNWAYSQFKQHSSGKHFITDLNEVTEEMYNDYYPKGFMFLTFKDESLSLGINYNNARSDEHFHKNIYSQWRQWFRSKDSTYWLSSHGLADRGGDTTVLAGLHYRGDKEDNVHLLNCWFTLKASGTEQNRIVTQELAYQSGYTGKRPIYVGTCIASVFANIYHYVKDSEEPVNRVIDSVYLSEHYTTFTKDIIYKASTDNIEDHSTLLVFKGSMKYGGDNGYVELVKKMAGAIGDSQYTGDKNVKAVIQSCVKNVPLQYRIKYKEPNTDLVNSNSDFYLLKTIDSNESQRVYGKLNTNRLYQLSYDNTGKPQVTFLNNSFKIRYLESIQLNPDETISGKFSKTFPEENNPFMHNTWDISNDLTLSNYKYQSIASRYYSIVTIYSDYAIQFADYDKNEVLLPFAKFVS